MHLPSAGGGGVAVSAACSGCPSLPPSPSALGLGLGLRLCDLSVFPPSWDGGGPGRGSLGREPCAALCVCQGLLLVPGALCPRVELAQLPALHLSQRAAQRPHVEGRRVHLWCHTSIPVLTGASKACSPTPDFPPCCPPPPNPLPRPVLPDPMLLLCSSTPCSLTPCSPVLAPAPPPVLTAPTPGSRPVAGPRVLPAWLISCGICSGWSWGAGIHIPAVGIPVPGPGPLSQLARVPPAL